MATRTLTLVPEADRGRIALYPPDGNGLSLLVVRDDGCEAAVLLTDDDRQKIATMLMTDFVKGDDNG